MRDRNFAISSSSSVIRTLLAIVLTVGLGLVAGYSTVYFNFLYLLAISVGSILLVITLVRPNWGVLILIGSTFAATLSFSQVTGYNITPSDFLVALLGIGLFTSSAAKRISFKYSYVFLLLALYLVIGFLSSIKAGELDFYLPRFVQFSEFGLAAFFFIQLRDVFNWKAILFVLTLSSSLISIATLYTSIFVTVFSKDINVLNTNSLAFLLDLTVPVAVTYSVTFFRDPIIKWLMPFTIIMIIGDLATFSRGSYVGLLLGLLLVLVLSGPTSWLKVIPIVLFLVIIVINLVPDQAFGTITSNTTLVDFRSYVWGTTFQIFLHNPILGIGANTLSTVLISSRFGYVAEGDPHNFILRLLVETGIIGLVLVFGIITLALRRTYLNFRAFRSQARTYGWAALNLGMLGGLVAYLVHALFDVFWVRGSGLLFWLYIGLAYALAAKYLEQKNPAEKQGE